MAASRVVIRPMTRAELDVVVDWAAAEGWNPGLHDADAFWETDPAGFVAAEMDGRLAGGGCAVAYGRSLGFLGLFLVRPDLRGSGVGADLWAARTQLSARLDPGAPVGMDGVLAMQPFYARGGYVLAHRDVRHSFTASKGGREEGIVPAAGLPFEALAAFDAEHFGAPRPAFLRRWLSMPESTALVATEGGRPTGLGVIRRCRAGHKVGPLFAARSEVADALLRSLAAGVPGETVYLDVPESNPAAVALTRRWGMTEVFQCGRMWQGRPPPVPHERIYGVTTFELG